MPELRKDPIIGRWVIISTERGKRPSDFSIEPEVSNVGFCPFCAGQEDKTPPEIIAYREETSEKDSPGWWVRVVPNKFPILQIEGHLNRAGEGMYDRMNGVGAHEIIIETPDHHKEIFELENKNIEDIIWVYRNRIIDLKKDVRFQYILIFKNRGTGAGALLSHPHSQLIATPIVPKRVKEELRGAKSYYEYKERCVFCDIVRQEINTRERLIIENEDFVVVEPFAPRFPFETWILPKVHACRFEDIQKREVISLARVLKEILERINKVLDNPPFNYIIHSAPLNNAGLPYYHWHIEIIPKLTKVAGFEWGTGFYVNPTSPEEAAKFLREVEE
ncbi:galactose-1-phosphate uridylyltransferase [bacterium]|nr:galactose-1-phosphate uridylyltransferase [bacterium]